MVAVIKPFVAIILGVAVFVVVFVVGEGLSAVLHPYPEGFDNTREEVEQHVAKYPGWVLALFIPIWALGVSASVWIAKRIGGRVSGAVTGVLLVILIAYNMYLLPYPIWFKVGMMFAVVFAAVFVFVICAPALSAVALRAEAD